MQNRNKFNFRLLILLLLCGCASTKVIKHPGDRDTGIRFYRPKPYLLVKPSASNGKMVEICIDYLPDYNEEYSIHMKTGLGQNNTQVSLDHGWNLTAVNVHVDTKAAEMLSSASGLVKTAMVARASEEPHASSWTVGARGVPLGYYEATTAFDRTCGKQISGWKYVGFMPFQGSQIVATAGSGIVGGDNTCEEIWGLVAVNGEILFKRMGDIGNEEINHARVEPSRKSAGSQPPSPAENHDLPAPALLKSTSNNQEPSSK